MTVGELKEKLKDINNDIKIYSTLNLIDVEDDRYDIDVDFELHTRNRDDGYIEIFNYKEIDGTILAIHNTLKYIEDYDNTRKN